MKKPFIDKAAFFFILTAFLFPLAAQEGSVLPFYPEISELKSSNHVFLQYQQDVQNANKALFRGMQPELQFYSYKAGPEDTIITIAARCSIRQDTLATINSVQESAEKIQGRTLILPVCDGLFIPMTPENSFEVLLASGFKDEVSEENASTISFGGRDFYYIPQAKFSPSQRAYFLNPGMSMPLENSVLTSAYGMRISPISGKWKMHKGIDLAAKKGSKVLACREGFVKYAIKGNPVYGNYIVLRHPNGMESLYAHLDAINVEQKQKVVTGQTLGTVGMTGLTTGPHLHFELTQNGSALNPENLLKN
ncbi:MAG: M23 family metallopeptidase [Treponema sp.]|nr:M23 family metallopeptidase [Candidatus Treponema equi]